MSRIIGAPDNGAVKFGTILASRRRHRRPGPLASRVASIASARTRRYLDARGKYRVFNTAVYRFYRSTAAPPAEGSTPWATNASLPHEPSDTFADGTHFLAVSRFNGVLDSGFLPIGPSGEPYLRMVVGSGAEDGRPPLDAQDVRLELRASGVVGIVAFYLATDADRADEWAITYTTNGSDPGEDSPDVTVAMPGGGMAVLDYELPGQANGTTVKVRLQTRRNDGTAGSPDWKYSDSSTILTATADAAGPAAPLSLDRWLGVLPEEV